MTARKRNRRRGLASIQSNNVSIELPPTREAVNDPGFLSLLPVAKNLSLNATRARQQSASR